MLHKCQGMPSKSWLAAYLRRYEDQRVTFQLSPESPWWELCTKEGAFKTTEPIYVTGVFSYFMKRPKDWPNIFAIGPNTLYLSFRKLMFKQGSQTARHPFARSNYDHNTHETEFELSEIRGLGLAERLALVMPRLGHTPGRISYSEGSSGKGSPSKQELPLPPRGSNSLDE